MISVVVPTRNAEDIEECLESLVLQNKKPLEIIVVFDKSADASVINSIEKYGARIIFDDHGTIGGAYAAGAATTKGGIVAFTDDDCVAPPDWLEKIEREFEEDIDMVSGEDLLPEKSSFFQRAAYQTDKARMVDEALYGEKAKNRMRAANIAYSRKVFEKENFNPFLKGLQEPEFHHRLFKAGFKMKFNPKIHVYHKRRDNMKSIFNQLYRNGKAKIELIKLHGLEITTAEDKLIFLYALALVFSIITLVAGSAIPLTLLVFAGLAYFILKPLVIVILTKEFQFYFHTLTIIVIRELGYFAGLIAGLPSIFKKVSK